MDHPIFNKNWFCITEAGFIVDIGTAFGVGNLCSHILVDIFVYFHWIQGMSLYAESLYVSETINLKIVRVNNCQAESHMLLS